MFFTKADQPVLLKFEFLEASKRPGKFRSHSAEHLTGGSSGAVLGVEAGN